MDEKYATSRVEEKFAALLSNANAVKAVASAVEGTLGPKGLDVMLVDELGDVTVTNDGVTVLEKMEVNHPAAKLIVKAAKSQEYEVGDGTTTATILAGALVEEGVKKISKGVPVAKVIEGLRLGVDYACKIIAAKALPLSLDAPEAKAVTLVACRDDYEVARIVLEGAKAIGVEKLLEEGFRFADGIVAKEGVKNEVFQGVIVNKAPYNIATKTLENIKVMVFDDALEPEQLEMEALATDAGFSTYRSIQEAFRCNVRKIVETGINLICTDRGIHSIAEEILLEAGIWVLSRVANKELRLLAEHTGARMLKRSSLQHSVAELKNYIGTAQKALADTKKGETRIINGKGKPWATMVIGAATLEVLEEKQRSASDAASALQAAVRGGVVPGGGAIEIAAAREVRNYRQSVSGMVAHGMECVEEALKQPLACIVSNAGYSALEKVEDVISLQDKTNDYCLGVNCDNGELQSMVNLQVLDPALVKIHALKTAGEVSEAILRVQTIIKKRVEYQPSSCQ